MYHRRPVLILTTSLITSLAAVARPACAQDLSAAFQEAVSKAMEKAFNRFVAVSPAIIPVQKGITSVTFTLANPTEDTLDVALSMSTVPPLSAMVEKASGGKMGKGLLAESSGTDALKIDTIDAQRSMAAWVKDLPPTLRLAPDEKRTITVKVVIPSTLTPGEYSAWMVATTKMDEVKTTDNPSGSRVHKVTISFGGTQASKGTPKEDDFKLTSGAKLTYLVK